MSAKLTIGMPVYDDYNGVYFTIQSLRTNLLFTEVESNVEFLVIDNNPNSDQGKATKDFCSRATVNYIPYTESRGTAAAKNQVFRNATTEWVMCIDSHIILKTQPLYRLLREDGLASYSKTSLYHGVLLLDQLGVGYDRMEPVWRGGMYGVWGPQIDIDLIKNSARFAVEDEISMHGMGLFMMHRDAWPGFSDKMEGFGGEEGYIHEKVRAQGGSVAASYELIWCHRFHNQAVATKYPNHWHERIANYYYGFVEDLGRKDLWRDCVDHFKEHLDEATFCTVNAHLEKRGLTMLGDKR